MIFILLNIKYYSLFPQDLVKAGLKMAIPENHYGRIVSCSVLALKAITTAAGFTDSDFRGVVAVVFCNHNKISCEVNVGDHIGQMIFEKNLRLLN